MDEYESMLNVYKKDKREGTIIVIFIAGIVAVSTGLMDFNQKESILGILGCPIASVFLALTLLLVFAHFYNRRKIPNIPVESKLIHISIDLTFVLLVAASMVISIIIFGIIL